MWEHGRWSHIVQTGFFRIGLMYSTMESRGETSDPFLLLSSQETGLINSKGSSRTREACASSTRALPGNKDPHPRELYLLLPGTTTNTGSLRLPWATQHPTCEKTAFPRTTQNILRGLQLEYQGWIGLEFGGYADIQKAKTKKCIWAKKYRKSVKFHDFSKPHSFHHGNLSLPFQTQLDPRPAPA